jgi:hypothetical protein
MNTIDFMEVSMGIDMSKPEFRHDCKKCEFLGRTIGGGKMFDLYVHMPSLSLYGPTLIARYGNEGSEYYSGPIEYISAYGHAELFVAKHLFETRVSARPAPERSVGGGGATPSPSPV